MAPTIKAMTITPEIAAEWLERNFAGNRPLSTLRVSRYAGAITRGEWRLNGETIKFNTAGELIDGQHRLRAIVVAGKAIDVFVARGVDDYDTVDQGKARSAADTMHISGRAAAALKFMWLFENEGHFPKGGQTSVVTTAQLREVTDRHPTLLDGSLRAVDNCARKLRRSRAMLAVAYYLLEQIDAEDTKSFFAKLESGAGLPDTSPIFRLRERLIAGGYKSALSPDQMAAIIFKAWNYFRDHRPMQALTWRSDEAFPTPH